MTISGSAEREAASEAWDWADSSFERRYRPCRLRTTTCHCHLRKLQVSLLEWENALGELICCCRDRDSVLRRAPVLKKSGLHVTEDLSKSVREVRANLTKYKKQQGERLILQKHPQVHANLEEAEPWFLLSPSIWQVIHWQQALCVGQRVGRGEDVWWAFCR